MDERRKSSGASPQIVELESKPQDETITRPPARSRLRAACTILTALGTMILQTSGETSVSIAMPTIGKDLMVPPPHRQWLVSAFALSSGCLLLTFGRLADLYGRRRLHLLGISITLAFSIGCSFAHEPQTAFILRAGQGIGLSAAMPAAGGMLAQSFPPSKMRGIAFATFSAGAPIGASIGMSAGGALTEKHTWRAIFWFSSCLALLCLLGGYFAFDADTLPLPFTGRNKELDAPEVITNRRVDWLGSFTVTAGLVLIVFVLGQSSGKEAQWNKPYMPILLSLGFLSLAMFIWWQYHLEKQKQLPSVNRCAYIVQPPPLMPLSLWARKKGRYAGIMIICFLNSAGFLAWNFWIQLFFQDYLHLDPLDTVLRLIPMFIFGVLCNIGVAYAVNWVPVGIILGIGTSFTSVACLLIAVIDPTRPKSYWAYEFPAAALIVFGADFMFAAGTLYVASISKPHEQSISSGIFQTMMSVGSATGVALSTLVSDVAIRHHLKDKHGPHSHVPTQVPLTTYRYAMWFAFAAASAATLLVIVGFWNVGIVGHRSPPRSPEADGVAVMDPEREPSQ